MTKISLTIIEYLRTNKQTNNNDFFHYFPLYKCDCFLLCSFLLARVLHSFSYTNNKRHRVGNKIHSNKIFFLTFFYENLFHDFITTDFFVPCSFTHSPRIVHTVESYIQNLLFAFPLYSRRAQIQNACVCIRSVWYIVFFFVYYFGLISIRTNYTIIICFNYFHRKIH